VPAFVTAVLDIAEATREPILDVIDSLGDGERDEDRRRLNRVWLKSVAVEVLKRRVGIPAP
jgi:hypothetical protein